MLVFNYLAHMDNYRAQVFRPTWKEFKDLNTYINHIELKGAHLAGIAKVFACLVLFNVHLILFLFYS